MKEKAEDKEKSNKIVKERSKKKDRTTADKDRE